jgi:hypothetical protein
MRELELGIKLSATTGTVLAESGAEANFMVKMEWSAAPTERLSRCVPLRVPNK